MHNDATRYKLPPLLCAEYEYMYLPPTHAQIVAHPSCLFAGTYYRAADEMHSGFTWADGGLVIALTPLNHSDAPRAMEARMAIRRALQKNICLMSV